MNLDKFLGVFKQSGSDNSYLKRYNEVGSSALLNLPELRDLFEEFAGANRKVPLETLRGLKILLALQTFNRVGKSCF